MRQHPLVNGATTWSTSTAGTAYAEDVKYDGNGNILTYKRNGGSTRGTTMDNLRYQYNRDANGYLKDNRLTQVIDDVQSDRYDEDISTQGANNYSYDNIGNLIRDVEGGINSVKWSVYGKITTIDKLTGKINYAYDGSGNRVYSYVQRSSNVRDSTWYVRDAQGNTLAVYGTNNGSAKVYWKEQHLYGSSRLGIWQPLIEKGANTSSTVWSQIGKKRYELSNHLGNVLAIISDKAVADGNYYKAELTGAQDYYPFGMLQPDRTFNLGSYRFGFNGKENDNDVKGIGQQQDYGMRVYDPRLGQFLSEDPLTADYPWYTPYQFAGNKPIQFIDRDGAEEENPTVFLLSTVLKTVNHFWIAANTYDIKFKGWKTIGNETAASAAGIINGLNSAYSFGLLYQSPEKIGISSKYADRYKSASTVMELAPMPGGGPNAGR